MKQLWQERWRIELRCNFIFGILFIFILNSCDLFSTRIADPPIYGTTTNPPATTPEQLFENLKNSVSTKNPKEYLNFFADTINSIKAFKFNPYQKALLQYPSIFAMWNLTSEERYFSSLVLKMNSSSSPFLSFENWRWTKFQSDSALFEADYNLFFPHKETGMTTSFKGRTHLYLIPSKSKNWVCYRWDDFETSKDSSWSLCKGYFSN